MSRMLSDAIDGTVRAGRSCVRFTQRNLHGRDIVIDAVQRLFAILNMLYTPFDPATTLPTN